MLYFLIIIIIITMCVSTHECVYVDSSVLWCAHGDQKTAFGSLFSPSTFLGFWGVGFQGKLL